ncbi:hypothetical protein Hanom_Chr15g01393961 [Helianthus anomalus]
MCLRLTYNMRRREFGPKCRLHLLFRNPHDSLALSQLKLVDDAIKTAPCKL